MVPNIARRVRDFLRSRHDAIGIVAASLSKVQGKSSTTVAEKKDATCTELAHALQASLATEHCVAKAVH